MLPKKNKVLSRSEISSIFKIGKFLSTPLFTIRWQNTEQSHLQLNPQIIIVVSKKISKSAVTRNHLKRQIKSIISHYLHYLPNNMNMILISKPSIRSKIFTEIQRDLKQVMSQLHRK